MQQHQHQPYQVQHAQQQQLAKMQAQQFQIGARLHQQQQPAPDFSKNKHGYRGVRQRPWGNYAAEIRDGSANKRRWVGTYRSSQDAARAYDAAAMVLHGNKAKTNFKYSPATVSHYKLAQKAQTEDMEALLAEIAAGRSLPIPEEQWFYETNRPAAKVCLPDAISSLPHGFGTRSPCFEQSSARTAAEAQSYMPPGPAAAAALAHSTFSHPSIDLLLKPQAAAAAAALMNVTWHNRYQCDVPSNQGQCSSVTKHIASSSASTTDREYIQNGKAAEAGAVNGCGDCLPLHNAAGNSDGGLAIAEQGFLQPPALASLQIHQQQQCDNDRSTRMHMLTAGGLDGSTAGLLPVCAGLAATPSLQMCPAMQLPAGGDSSAPAVQQAALAARLKATGCDELAGFSMPNPPPASVEHQYLLKQSPFPKQLQQEGNNCLQDRQNATAQQRLHHEQRTQQPAPLSTDQAIAATALLASVFSLDMEQQRKMFEGLLSTGLFTTSAAVDVAYAAGVATNKPLGAQEPNMAWQQQQTTGTANLARPSLVQQSTPAVAGAAAQVDSLKQQQHLASEVAAADPASMHPNMLSVTAGKPRVQSNDASHHNFAARITAGATGAASPMLGVQYGGGDCLQDSQQQQQQHMFTRSVVASMYTPTAALSDGDAAACRKNKSPGEADIKLPAKRVKP